MGAWYLGQFWVESQQVSIIHYDSQSSIHLARNPVNHERRRNTLMHVRLHFIGEIVSNNIVTIKKIATTENPTNMMTKLLPIDKFKHCLNLFNICKC